MESPGLKSEQIEEAQIDANRHDRNESDEDSEAEKVAMQKLKQMVGMPAVNTEVPPVDSDEPDVGSAIEKKNSDLVQKTGFAALSSDKDNDDAVSWDNVDASAKNEATTNVQE